MLCAITGKALCPLGEGQGLIAILIALQRAVVQKVKATHWFQMDAMVILRDHLHAVLTPPVGDCDYATRVLAANCRERTVQQEQ